MRSAVLETGLVSQYDVGPGGELSPQSPAMVAGGSGPNGVAVSPDGRDGIADRIRRNLLDLLPITVRPATHAGSRGKEVSFMCGSEVAHRTLVVFTWDHRYDHGPNKSASLAQHAFLVSRFDDGYHLWYWEH